MGSQERGAPLWRHPQAADPLLPLRGSPTPGSRAGLYLAASRGPVRRGAPPHPRRRVPGAQPRADPSGRRGSAAGLSGPGENKGARRRGRGKEAPPAEERGGSVPRGRGELSLRPSPASPARAAGAGAALPDCRAHTDAPLLPGQARSARPGTRAGRTPRPRRQARSPELAGRVHPGALTARPTRPRSGAKRKSTARRGIRSYCGDARLPLADWPWRLVWIPTARRRHLGNPYRAR